jgi:hypothetical protein
MNVRFWRRVPLYFRSGVVRICNSPAYIFLQQQRVISGFLGMERAPTFSAFAYLIVGGNPEGGKRGH